MTTPEPTPDDIQAVFDQHDAHQAEVTAYLHGIDAMPGPLGDLFRAIGRSYVAFTRDEQDGHTTMAEYERIMNIIDPALACRTWLQEHP